MRPHLRRRLLQLLTLAASAWYALWACAPPSTLRSITVDLDQPSEFGGGLTYAAPIGEAGTCGGSLLGCEGTSAQLWYQRRLGQRVTLGGSLFAGGPAGVGGGLLTRFHLAEAERFRLGTDLDVGFLWAGVALPMAGRVGPDLWLYTAPGAQIANLQQVRLPVGVAYGATESMWLHAEGSVGWSSPSLSFGLPIWTAGGSVSYRW